MARTAGQLALIAGLVAAGGYLLYNGSAGQKESAGTIRGPSRAPFTLSYPAGWRALSAPEVERLPSSPLAVVRRRDGKGFLVVRREGGAPRDLNELAHELTGELKKRFPDFRKQTSRIMSIRAGVALVYSYARARAGTAHTVVVVPARGYSFELSSVARGDDKRLALQIAAMVRQFDF